MGELGGIQKVNENATPVMEANSHMGLESGKSRDFPRTRFAIKLSRERKSRRSLWFPQLRSGVRSVETVQLSA
jgi:hypothetical protein